MSFLIFISEVIFAQKTGALIPFIKEVSPVKTLASSHKLTSIKVCKVCVPPSIITD